MFPVLRALARSMARVMAAACWTEITIAAGPAGAHWAYQPVASQAPGIPAPGWIDAQLEDAARAARIDPAGPAHPEVLCRRVHLVLTGLPPSPDQLARFLARPAPSRMESTVDELLASPAFGEHWGRHWLDVVRYADSVTLRGFVFREAWRYRDYVVHAFNTDMGFADFAREQLAGDLLGSTDVGEARRQRIATTFWALGDTHLEEQDKRQLELDVVDEQLEVLGKAFLAQTVTCARCHDHKFDPIPTRDYHALAGILSGTRLLRHANVSEWIETPLPLEHAEASRFEAAEARLARLESELKATKAGARTGGVASPDGPRGLRDLEAAVAAARAEARRPHVMAPVEATATNLPVLRRGAWRHPGEVVPRGMLRTAFKTGAPDPAGPGSGRLELAAWIVAEDQPLTWRVHANRVWHWTFGRGLVASVDNFGTTGDAPTHPRLLDALATGFRRGGGSTKHLVRALVLTRAFQRSSDPGDPAVSRGRREDPSNRWLARFQPRTMEAEALRDAMWMAGGGLVHEGRGRAPFPAGVAADYGQAIERPVRSLYLPQFRNARPDFLVAFDGADPGRVTGARETSTVAPQALLLLNHPLVREQAARAAARVLEAPDPVGALWRRVLGRAPTTGERGAADGHLLGAASREEGLTELAHALLASLDFRRIP